MQGVNFNNAHSTKTVGESYYYHVHVTIAFVHLAGNNSLSASLWQSICTLLVPSRSTVGMPLLDPLCSLVGVCHIHCRGTWQSLFTAQCTYRGSELMTPFFACVIATKKSCRSRSTSDPGRAPPGSRGLQHTTCTDSEIHYY